MTGLNPVLALENATTTEEEIACLETVRKCLCPRETDEVKERRIKRDEDSDDMEWLKQACNDESENVNPFPFQTPEDILTDQEQLNRFTFYLFERRYGWSENKSHVDLTALGKDANSTRPDSRSGRPGPWNIESKLKGQLNDLLDEFLKWYLCQNNLSEKLLRSLTESVIKASSLPVVRNQAVVHILEWLKLMTIKGFDSLTFSLVKNFIVAALTDVWSAIRNACAVRLPKVVESLNLDQLECLFMELERICQTKVSSWQAKEGAVMGMTTIIRSFHLINLSVSADSSGSPKFKMFVKFGKERLPTLPEFITDSLYSVVFSLLAHPQLSIREHASKAFTSILSRSELQYIDKSFQQVIIRLCKDTGVDINSQIYENLPHHAVVRPDFTFLDAYEAQGLLEVSVFLIKRIPVQLLMQRWPLYFSTFNLYLMHPASTVRQASSVVFKYLVTKDSSSPSMLRLVLQSLSEHWKTKTHTYETLKNGPTVISEDENCNQCRSPCYDHCNYKPTESNATSPKRLSIKSIGKTFQEINKQDLDSSLSSTWEWREGRLLAYELVLKYLIANHIHYVFPSYVLSYTSRHASCSVDEAVLKRASGMYTPQTFRSEDSGSTYVAASKSMTILEGIQNTSGRCSAPGTRKEKDESLKSKSWGLELRKRERTSSFTKQDKKPPRLVRQKTVGGLPTKAQDQGVLKKYDNKYYAESLLNRAKLMDCEDEAQVNTKTQIISKEYKRLTKETETVVKWMTLLHFKSVHEILTEILYQTIECVGDSRWELRRMAQQILPLITETIRWFDITILEEFWAKYLSRSYPLFCYSGCIALKYSISHAGKLRQFIDQPPVTWKDIESCCSSAMNVYRSVDNGLQLWIPKVVNLLTNITIYDKITIIAMEVLLTRQAFLPQDSRLKEKHASDHIIYDVIISIFLKAHPDSPCALSLKNSPLVSSNQDKSVFFASDEFLSVSSNGFTPAEQARQAERALFLELHHLFTSFINSCKFNLQITMLPVLVHSLHTFCDDTAVSHSLTQCIIKIVDALWKRNESDDVFPDKRDVDVFLDLAIWELSFLITQRSIDLVILKQLQEIFLNIFKYVDRPGHIKDVLQAVSTRLNYEPDLVRFMVTSDEDNDDGDDDVPCSELQLLSNDIPASPVTDSPLLQDDDDEMPDDSVDRIIHESLALNTSHDSLVNGGSDVYGHEETGGDSDEAFSDWDSCEEPVNDNTREALGEFINQLYTLFQEKTNGKIYFEQELKKCGNTDEIIIQSMLQSFS